MYTHHRKKRILRGLSYKILSITKPAKCNCDVKSIPRKN